MKDANISTKQVVWVTIFLVVFAIGGFLMLKINRAGSLPTRMSPERTLEGIRLVGVDNKPLDSKSFSRGVYLFLFFKGDGGLTNPNLPEWRNLVNFFGDKIHVIGVLPAGNLSNLMELTEKELNFPIYFLEQGQSLLQQLGINTFTENTILVNNNKIIIIKPGLLLGTDLNTLIATIKNSVKNQ